MEEGGWSVWEIIYAGAVYGAVIMGIVMLWWPRPWVKKKKRVVGSRNWKWLLPDKNLRRWILAGAGFLFCAAFPGIATIIFSLIFILIGAYAVYRLAEGWKFKVGE